MQKQNYSNWKGRLIGDLLGMDLLKIKPNISALARKYKLNRATVKKYYESGGMPQKMRLKRNSKYDEYDELIREKMSDSLVKISALYQYMKNIYKDKINFTYSGLKSYIERKGYRNINSNIVPHALYETGPGEQLQCDWKEDLSIETKSGEIIDIGSNIDVVEKSGAWYSYNGEKIGQGRENAKLYLENNPKIMDEIEHKIRVHYDLEKDKDTKKNDKA